MSASFRTVGVWVAPFVFAVVSGCAGCGGGSGTTEIPSIDLSGGPGFPLEAHLESTEIAAGKYTFEELFEAGSDLFHTPYNGLDGIGIARLPDGSPLARFSVPPTGGMGGGMVSSQSCGECHNMPHAAAAGLASTNRAGDPDKDGMPPFLQRATTSLWGDGVVQLLAQEITEDLQAIRAEAASAAGEQPGTAVERELTAKGISYGTLLATADDKGEVSFNFSAVEGVDPDLVVRPVMIAPSTFLTPELWGVGNTGPWLHDARAGTLREAVLLHGEDAPPPVGDPGRSEAQEARDAFAAMPVGEQEALVTFLRSLRTYAPPRDAD